MDVLIKPIISDRDRINAMGRHIPLQRVSNPEEHTDLYMVLASANGARYITGTLLVSDGGLTSGQ